MVVKPFPGVGESIAVNRIAVTLVVLRFGLISADNDDGLRRVAIRYAIEPPEPLP